MTKKQAKALDGTAFPRRVYIYREHNDGDPTFFFVIEEDVASLPAGAGYVGVYQLEDVRELQVRKELI